jgi:hypothetical protein
VLRRRIYLGIHVKTLIDVAVPLITFVLLGMVGSSLDRSDFARVGPPHVI